MTLVITFENGDTFKVATTQARLASDKEAWQANPNVVKVTTE